MWIKLDYKRRNVQESVSRIHRLVESLPDRFLTRGELQKVGIRAVKRSLAHTGYFTFSPCFFTARPPDFASNSLLDRGRTNKSAGDEIGEDNSNTPDAAAVEDPSLRYPSILGKHHGDRLDKMVPASFALSNFTCLSDKGYVTCSRFPIGISQNMLQGDDQGEVERRPSS